MSRKIGKARRIFKCFLLICVAKHAIISVKIKDKDKHIEISQYRRRSKFISSTVFK